MMGPGMFDAVWRQAIIMLIGIGILIGFAIVGIGWLLIWVLKHIQFVWN